MSKQESTADTISAWFGQRLPEEWVARPSEITVDREEITVVLALAGPEYDAEATEAARAEAVAGYLARWRSDTRAQRIAIAREAEHRFERKVAWGAQVFEHHELFTHLAVPVMTRLRQGERQVLDTLVDAGVARSRAHALAWCVRLVGENTETWLRDLREAMESVAKVRQAGPAGSGAL